MNLDIESLALYAERGVQCDESETIKRNESLRAKNTKKTVHIQTDSKTQKRSVSDYDEMVE